MPGVIPAGVRPDMCATGVICVTGVRTTRGVRAAAGLTPVTIAEWLEAEPVRVNVTRYESEVGV
jgi:hypothetical protein